MSSQNTPFAFAGSLIGFGLGGPAGASIGGTVGTLAQVVFARPKDPAKGGDAHWGGVTLGTAVPRGWANHRTDGFVFWGVRNKDGSYLFPHDVGKSKKAGSTSVTHYHGTFAFHILDTGLTFPDGRQVERSVVVDRVWMADKVAWTNKDAYPYPSWDGSVVYDYGDYVSHGGNVYASIGDANKGHEPGHSGGTWWQNVSTGKNIPLTIHPQAGESTFTMGPSTVMASHDGVANTPCFRGSTYGVVNDLDLYDLGNQLPWGSIRTDWHFADPTYTLGEFLADVCSLCGMTPDMYDFSAATDLMPGYRQTSRMTGQDLVSQPLMVLGYDLATVDGVVRAIKRGGPVTATIAADELGATITDESSGGDDDEGDLVTETIPADRLDLHSSLKLGYYNRQAGYRQDFERATRNDHRLDNPNDVSTELVLSDDQAAQAANYLLDTEHLEAGAEFGISLLGTRSSIAPGDPITVPWNDLPTRFKVTKTEFIQNLVKCTLARDEPAVMNRAETGSSGLTAIDDDGSISPTALVVLSPATDLSDEFALHPGFYAFANGRSDWPGCTVVYTFDPPGAATRDWVTGPTITTASTFGTTLGALRDPGATAAPVAPINLAAAAGNAQVALSWSASSGATSYSVKRATVSGGPYAVVQSGLASPSFTDTGLANGTTYRYVVSGTNAGGESPNSAEVSATPVQPVMTPAAPTNLTAQGGSGFVNLAWSSSSGATSYSVQRSTTSGGETALTSGLTSASYTDSNLSAGTTYFYTVTATNSAGTSGISNEASATTAPAATTLTATAGTGQIALSWPTTGGATSYTLKRGTSSGSHPTTVVSGLAGTMYTDIGLTNGTAYSYVVEAVNSGGTGADSSEATATPIAIPTGLTASPGNGQITLAWNPATGATGYKIYVGTTNGGPYPTMSTSSTASATVPNLTNGTTYYAIVTSTNASGESNASAQVSATPVGSSSGNPQVPQGGSNSFAYTGSSAPQTSNEWQIVDSAGTVVATGNIGSASSGYQVAYSSSSGQLTVTVPSSATVATNYTAKYFSTTGSPVRPYSAPFDIVASNLVTNPPTQNPQDPGAGGAQAGG